MDCPKFELSVAEGSGTVNEAMEELLCQLKRDYVKSVTMQGLEPQAKGGEAMGEKKSRLYNMKKALKKRIVRSRSDTF